MLQHNIQHVSFLPPSLNSRNWMQPFLLQPPNVHSQQSSQRNPLWHLHHAPQWLCVSVCVCTVWVCTQLLMKRDRLCWGLFFQAMRVLWYSRWTVGVWFLFFVFFARLNTCSFAHVVMHEWFFKIIIIIIMMSRCMQAYEWAHHTILYTNVRVFEMRSRSRPLHLSLQVIKI